MTLLLLLLSLALVDGVFSGVRAGLGRSGLLAQSHLNLRNAWLGLALELVLLPLLLTYGGVCLHLQASVDVDAVRAGGAMLWVLGSYATLVLAVMTLWTIPRSDVRELCSVLVLGPCTFARPYVIVGAVVVGVTTTSEPLVWGGRGLGRRAAAAA